LPRFGSGSNPLLALAIITAKRQLCYFGDNGIGVRLKNVKASGVGIASMISRAEMFDGKIEIESEPGRRYTLRAVFTGDKMLV